MTALWLAASDFPITHISGATHESPCSDANPGTITLSRMFTRLFDETSEGPPGPSPFLVRMVLVNSVAAVACVVCAMVYFGVAFAAGDGPGPVPFSVDVILWSIVIAVAALGIVLGMWGQVLPLAGGLSSTPAVRVDYDPPRGSRRFFPRPEIGSSGTSAVSLLVQARHGDISDGYVFEVRQSSVKRRPGVVDKKTAFAGK